VVFAISGYSAFSAAVALAIRAIYSWQALYSRFNITIHNTRL